MDYPLRHHPCYFLEDALRDLGAEAEVVRDGRTEGCWGLLVNGKPMAWLIDNRWQYERDHEDPAARTLMERGVLVCCAQRPDAERIGSRWLPLAVTPGYRALETEKTHDVAFVGTVRDASRSVMLTDAASRHTLRVEEGVFGEDAVRAYCAARVGLNIPTAYGHEHAYDSANMRCFEVLVTGTPLLTAREDYMDDLGIVHGKTAMLYDSPAHLLWLIDKLLEYPENAVEMGRAAQQLAQARHTYAHRAEQVLEWLA